MVFYIFASTPCLSITPYERKKAKK